MTRGPRTARQAPGDAPAPEPASRSGASLNGCLLGAAERSSGHVALLLGLHPAQRERGGTERLEGLASALRHQGLRVVQGPLDVEALRRIGGWHATWRPLHALSVVLLDVSDAPTEGLSVLSALRRRDGELPVILLAAPATPKSQHAGANVILDAATPTPDVASLALFLAERRWHELDLVAG